MHSGLPSVSRPNDGPYPEPFADDPLALDGAAGPKNRNPLPRRLLAVLLRFKWLVPIPIALGMGMGVMAARGVSPEYTARATLWIGSTDARGGNTVQSGGMLQQHNWIDLLRSYAVLDSVVAAERLYLSFGPQNRAPLFRDFGLEESFRPGAYRLEVDSAGRTFTLSRGDGSVVERGAVAAPVGRTVGFRWRPDPRLLRGSEEVMLSVIPPREAAFNLADRIGATLPGENAQFLRLELGGDDPEKITSILNTLADRYVVVAADLKRARMREVASALGEQLAHSAENLAEEERSLQSFRRSAITQPGGEGGAGGTAHQGYFALQAERDQVRRDREAIEAAMAAPERLATALELIPSVQRSAALTQALQELTARGAELRTAGAQFTPLHASVRQVQGRVDSLQAHTIPTLARSLAAELGRRETELERRIGDVSSQLQGIPARAIEEGRRARRLAVADDLYRMLQRRHDEARLAAITTSPDVRILDRAAVPFTPVSDGRFRVVLMMTLAGVGVVVLGAFLFDRFNPRLAYPEQLTGPLGLMILGSIPRLRVPARRQAVATAQAQESLRALQLSLLHAGGSMGPMVVTVTSPQSGDGKSFVSANLAMTFAEQGHRTLLIDADLRRGHLHDLLACTRKPGLTEYLRGSATIDQIVQPTQDPRLSMISTGSRSAPGPELLASGGMAELLLRLRSRFSVIIVDSPPIGACNDPLVLATLTRDLLLVVRADQTRTDLLEMNLELLGRLPVRVLGTVINDVAPEAGVYRAYSYFGDDSYDSLPAAGAGASAGLVIPWRP